MSFLDVLQSIDRAALQQLIASATPDAVERAIASGHIDENSIPLLFSEAAGKCLESMAQLSAAITERRFGKVIQLYVPQYLSNECVNKCTYCGFSHELAIPRVTLTPTQVLEESELLWREGFRHILLVSGEDRRHVSMEYLLEVVRGLRQKFESISIEIQPLKMEEYRRLVEVGVDGLALYQEIYDPERYSEYHLAGPKKNYENRVRSIEYGGEAGMRSLGIGALLGLSPWRMEAALLAMHGRWLQRRFWQSRVSVSFPRIQPNAHEYRPDFPVYDRDLVQMICAMRLILPDAELVLSTRESARLRDNVIGLGITRMSAGSRTNPGGYSHLSEEGEQFGIEDARTPHEVAEAIAARGYEPVWKDFDREFSGMIERAL